MVASPFLPWVTVSVAAAPEEAGQEVEDAGRGTGEVAPEAATEAVQTGMETPVRAWIAVAAGVLGLVAAGVTAAGRVPPGVRLAVASGVLGAITAWRGYSYAREPDTLLFLRDEALLVSTPGIGLWVLTVGVVLVLLAAIMVGLQGRRA